MFFKYDSKGTQSGISDPKVDEMIAKATAATGDERAKDWSELFAYLHDDVVPDVLLFHMVGFARVGDKIDLHADHRDQLAARARGHRVQVSLRRGRAPAGVPADPQGPKMIQAAVRAAVTKRKVAARRRPR